MVGGSKSEGQQEECSSRDALQSGRQRQQARAGGLDKVGLVCALGFY